jgi:hypothetical protein
MHMKKRKINNKRWRFRVHGLTKWEYEKQKTGPTEAVFTVSDYDVVIALVEGNLVNSHQRLHFLTEKREKESKKIK